MHPSQVLYHFPGAHLTMGEKVVVMYLSDSTTNMEDVLGFAAAILITFLKAEVYYIHQLQQ